MYEEDAYIAYYLVYSNMILYRRNEGTLKEQCKFEKKVAREGPTKEKYTNTVSHMTFEQIHC